VTTTSGGMAQNKINKFLFHNNDDIIIVLILRLRTVRQMPSFESSVEVIILVIAASLIVVRVLEVVVFLLNRIYGINATFPFLFVYMRCLFEIFLVVDFVEELLVLAKAFIEVRITRDNKFGVAE